MSRHLFFAAALLSAASAAAEPTTAPDEAMTKVIVPASRDAEWSSYRHAYKAAAMFEQHTRTRPLIQAHMQVRPRQAGGSLEGLKMMLMSESMTLEIPVDAIGRSTLPMLKKAYDEDAVLRLNRQQGHYRFSGRYTIKERDDRVYSVAQLMAACEQMISAQRASGNLFRMLGKKCAGVTFVYAPSDLGAGIEFRDVTSKASVIAALDAEPFESGKIGLYKVATYRFGAWPAQGDVVTARRPLAIGTLYE